MMIVLIESKSRLAIAMLVEIDVREGGVWTLIGPAVTYKDYAVEVKDGVLYDEPIDLCIQYVVHLVAGLLIAFIP